MICSIQMRLHYLILLGINKTIFWNIYFFINYILILFFNFNLWTNKQLKKYIIYKNYYIPLFHTNNNFVLN